MPDQTPSMPPLTDAEIAEALRPLYQPEALAALLGIPSLMADFRAVALAQAAKVQAVADERVREALAELRDEIAEFDHKLVSWANAYPEDVFPKPDLAAVRAALEAAGLSLDCVSAHSMRHVASKLSESFGVVRALARPTLSLGPSKGTL